MNYLAIVYAVRPAAEKMGDSGGVNVEAWAWAMVAAIAVSAAVVQAFRVYDCKIAIKRLEGNETWLRGQYGDAKEARDDARMERNRIRNERDDALETIERIQEAINGEGNE